MSRSDYDLTENSSIEFHYLRLDQTDVEFPGQLFDMNLPRDRLLRGDLRTAKPRAL